jgi:hypothetical protein
MQGLEAYMRSQQLAAEQAAYQRRLQLEEQRLLQEQQEREVKAEQARAQNAALGVARDAIMGMGATGPVSSAGPGEYQGIKFSGPLGTTGQYQPMNEAQLRFALAAGGMKPNEILPTASAVGTPRLIEEEGGIWKEYTPGSGTAPRIVSGLGRSAVQSRFEEGQGNINARQEKSLSAQQAAARRQYSQALRGDFQDYTKDLEEWQSKYRSIKSAAAQAGGWSSVSDPALVSMLSRVISKESVVTEGDQKRLAGMSSTLERVGMTIAEVFTGRELPDSVRREIISMLDSFDKDVDAKKSAFAKELEAAGKRELDDPDFTWSPPMFVPSDEVQKYGGSDRLGVRGR